MEDANRLLIAPKRFLGIISIPNKWHYKARSGVDVFSLDQPRPQLRSLVSPLIPGMCVARLTARHFSIETVIRPLAARFVVVAAVPPA